MTDISEMTAIEIKAAAYDTYREGLRLQAQLQLLEQELALRAEPQDTEVQQDESV